MSCSLFIGSVEDHELHIKTKEEVGFTGSMDAGSDVIITSDMVTSCEASSEIMTSFNCWKAIDGRYERNPQCRPN